jgi:methylmalonyl-CoA/ethylmalonyl-CoA epimerase
LALPGHGVTVAFVELENTKIELIEPLGEHSPIAKFLAENPGGAIHHLCFEVADIFASREQLKWAGARVLGDGRPKTGAHGNSPFEPEGFCGNLDRTRTDLNARCLASQRSGFRHAAFCTGLGLIPFSLVG